MNTNTEHRLLDASGRSMEEAVQQIQQCTRKENAVKPVILADLKHRWPNVKWEILDNGINNDGTYVDASQHTHEDFLAPDWKVRYDDKEILLEALVQTERQTITSLKINKVRHAISVNGNIALIRENYWVLFTTASLQHLLDTFPVTSDPKRMGGYPKITLYSEDLIELIQNGLVKRYDYSSSAMDLMGPLRKNLFTKAW